MTVIVVDSLISPLILLQFFYRPPIKWLSNSLFVLLISMKICPKQVRRYNVGGPSSVTISLPGIDPVDAERRKYEYYNIIIILCLDV